MKALIGKRVIRGCDDTRGGTTPYLTRYSLHLGKLGAVYLVTMRKPGVNAEPVGKDEKDFPVSMWQEWASPVWMDINQSDTLQKESAREQADERHICPLQLPVIERGIRLWSNPGDLIIDPFTGIGSSGVVALRCKRRFKGWELKPSYARVASMNLHNAATGILKQGELMGLDDEAEGIVV